MTARTKVFLVVGATLAVAFLGFMTWRVWQFVQYMRDHPRQEASGEAAFRAANKAIIRYAGQEAFGNTPRAREVAEAFGRNLRKANERLFTEGKPGLLSLTQGRFLTYCQRNESSSAFLVHVPELHQYTEEARQLLHRLAWLSAHQALREAGVPEGHRVAVGVKGAVLYSSIQVGTHQDGADAVEYSGDSLRDLPRLYPFFAAPPPASARPAVPALPAAWAPLDLPTAGLVVVSPETNEHGFYADYRGSDRQALLDEVARRLVAKGFTRSCAAEDGYVLGFTKGGRQLAVKVDVIGVLVLSVFDAKGKDPILHGLCFGRYRAGPSHTLDAKEKEQLWRQPEAEDESPRP